MDKELSTLALKSILTSAPIPKLVITKQGSKAFLGLSISIRFGGAERLSEYAKPVT